MVSYTRPSFPVGTFRDSSGAVIDYGKRWAYRASRMPPEETYSVVTNPERFAPLHAVADALIDYLTKRYEATANENIAFSADLMSRHDDALRAVRVTPSRRDAAPLTFVYTSFPGVILHTGLLRDLPFPDCGCDACDETAVTAANGLEEGVFAVVEGRYQETLGAGEARPLPPGQWSVWPGPASTSPDTVFPLQPDNVLARYHIVAADGSFRGRGELALSGDRTEEQLERVRPLLESLENGWQPWPFRET